jgi:spore germination protein YaaH
MRFLLIGFITILICLNIVFIYSDYRNYLDSQPTSSRLEAFSSNLMYPKKIIKEKSLRDLSPSQDVKFNAWIPTWSMAPGLSSFKKNINNFETISPVFYSIQENGELAKNLNGLEQIKEISSQNNIKVIPTISSFNPDAMSQNLNDLEKLNQFLINEIENNNFDGIDLNYESIYLKDKALFFEHLSFLSNYLKNNNKILSVTVLSKWGSDNRVYSFAPQTREVMDYRLIGEIADQVRIMTYDFTVQGSSNPGPIAPINWIEEVLIYATNRIPAKKVVLGIHLYGYFWGGGEQKARALDYRQIAQIKNGNISPDSFFSEKYSEGALKYVGLNGQTYFGYYSSPETVEKRINIAKEYGLKSVVFWRLGNDPL